MPQLQIGILENDWFWEAKNTLVWFKKVAYGGETWEEQYEDITKLERNDMMMCNVKLKDRKSSGKLVSIRNCIQRAMTV